MVARANAFAYRTPKAISIKSIWIEKFVGFFERNLLARFAG
jgi:hypothetical protein